MTVLTETLKALAEPTRLHMVELLKERPYSVNECAKLLDIGQPQASKHLKILNDAGLVVAKTAAQKRIYSLIPEAFCQLDEWVKSFTVLWDNRLARLDGHLTERKDKR